VLFATFFLALAGRVVKLTTIDAPELRGKAIRQHTRRVSMTSQRGPIVDRHGDPLALTRHSAAVYIRPPQWQAGSESLGEIADLLDLPADVVAVKAEATAPFVWLDRQVPLDRWEQLERLGLLGIGSERSQERIYPQGALAGQLLGFIGIDGQGLEGVEQALDSDLAGEVDDRAVERDAWGRGIEAGDGRWTLPRAGAKVELTIDSGLQRVCEAELDKARLEYGAKAGLAVVLAPRSGEVLAMATVPRFDPNNFDQATRELWRNRPVTDSFEPGSTMKAIMAALALEEAVVRPDEAIFCENGRYRVGRRVIHDHHSYGLLPFSEVIALSSNIGSAKIAERLGKEKLSTGLKRFGFGSLTGINLPGESAGVVLPIEQWDHIHLVTNAFGQGSAVTALQLTRAFAALANGGLLMRPFVVRRVVDEGGRVLRAVHPQVERRVVSKKTAAAVTEMLTAVVEAGTGKAARIEGIRVAGKTGTAQKVDPKLRRYHPTDRMSSFIGYAPAEDPELAILVVLDTPKKATYGGVVAAPVFQRIAEYGLRRAGLLRPMPADPEPRRPPVEAPVAVQLASHPSPDLPATVEAGGMPSFLGLGMREALVRARLEGWRVSVEGTGYVVAQVPEVGALPEGKELRLRFGSGAS
jgi:cell division protein FtsI (penicillin-binding protein 3)